MSALEWTSGSSPDAFCNAYYARRPDWIDGSLSGSDARFLFRSTLAAGTAVAVELGTASGFSTGLLCLALDCARREGRIGPDFSVASYDISPLFYADESKRVGEAAREQLPPELMSRVTLRNPASALNIREDHPAGGIEFLFIDANHRHPWPTLDLLAVLDTLGANAAVVLHDINLPVLNPRFQDWGAKHLFDGLTVEKEVPGDCAVPNIGKITIPDDRGRLRAQMRDIVYAHDWEADVRPEYLARLGITESGV